MNVIGVDLRLDDARRLRPNDSPIAAAAFVNVRMVHGAAVDDITPRINIEAVVAISNHSSVAVQLYGDFAGFPPHIVQLTGFKGSEVLLLSQRSAGRVYELEVIGVNAACSLEVNVDEGAETLMFDLPNTLGS